MALIVRYPAIQIVWAFISAVDIQKVLDRDVISQVVKKKEHIEHSKICPKLYSYFLIPIVKFLHFWRMNVFI